MHQASLLGNHSVPRCTNRYERADGRGTTTPGLDDSVAQSQVVVRVTAEHTNKTRGLTIFGAAQGTTTRQQLVSPDASGIGPAQKIRLRIFRLISYPNFFVHFVRGVGCLTRVHGKYIHKIQHLIASQTALGAARGTQTSRNMYLQTPRRYPRLRADNGTRTFSIGALTAGPQGTPKAKDTSCIYRKETTFAEYDFPARTAQARQSCW
jgi:hypothetical protein